MDIIIYPKKLTGTLNAISSKSQAHRLLICAAFSDRETILQCTETNKDIEATAACLRSIGANIQRTSSGYYIQPILTFPHRATLPCCESGSTLRFMLPIVGALGIDATFQMEGRLPQRPMSPLWEEMERCGCVLTRPTSTTIRCTGKLRAANFCIDGGVSSQFVTGLLFAMALIPGECNLNITGKLKSQPYIEITKQALALFGVHTEGFHVSSCAPFSSPGHIAVEGDWSNAAFFLAANKLDCNIDVCGLSSTSAQGDKAIENILNIIDSNITIDVSDIPDLVPILAVVGGAKNGITFTNIERLRLKESDRVATVSTMLKQLGADVESTESKLQIYPGQ